MWGWVAGKEIEHWGLRLPGRLGQARRFKAFGDHFGAFGTKTPLPPLP